MAITPVERQSLLSDLVAVALRDLVELWRRATVADVEFARFLIEAFPEIAYAYASVAADLAADWYEQSAPSLDYQAVPGVIDLDSLAGSARWALGAPGDTALGRLSGTMQRSVYNGARETTILNVEAESGATWARHASANACPWCRMMATRGAVYLSSETAMKSHDYCHCVAVEARPGQSYEPPPYVAKWEEEYIRARDLADSGDPKAIQAAWRQLLAADA